MKSVRLSHYLYTASLFFLIFLTAVCVALSAADVIIQALTDNSNSGQLDYRNLIVVGGSYVLLALAAILISCSRMLTVRGSLQDIPKLYIPIKKEDLPKKVFQKIRLEFEQSKQTRKLAEPRPEDIQVEGWAKPGNPLFEGLYFKQALTRTPAIVENVAKTINPDYFRPPYVPVRQYVEFLVHQGLIDKQLGFVYLQGYESARFSQDPMSQDQYMEIMKHLAAILQNMGYSLKNNNNNINSSNHSNQRKSSHQTTTTNESNISINQDYHKPRKATQQRRRLSNSPKSLLFDDDTQSVNTWISRTTSNSSNMRNEQSDDYSAYDEDEVRNEIYELLMKDRTSQHQA